MILFIQFFFETMGKLLHKHKTTVMLFGLMLLAGMNHAQNTNQALTKAVKNLLADSQMKHAIMGLYVVNTTTNEIVFDFNGEVGLAPASTQKIITAATALELLGTTYQYKTLLGYQGKINGDSLEGDVVILPSGDPTFGSSRYVATKEDMLARWTNKLVATGIKNIKGDVQIESAAWGTQTIPGGWIWDDMGNYYGAGATAFNWLENKYQLQLKPGKKVGDKAEILGAEPGLYHVELESELTTGPSRSGDNAYIYLSPYGTKGYIRGTIPLGEDPFTIQGSFPDAGNQFTEFWKEKLYQQQVAFYPEFAPIKKPIYSTTQIIDSVFSPTMDSLVYWFMQKSINLYGEAMVKTMGLEKAGVGTTEKGLEIMKKFWQERGVDKSAFKLLDGSGLSPQNRVTAKGLVQVLQYAKAQPWFDAYYQSFPLYNKMKLKSGTISGAKAFAGYHTAKDGTEYAVAFIINNADGVITNKMFVVLDALK
jgi:D-alanyl-D-alanine carboxypeptidase/D-alanyl-D-alanine-endopeptidase (penicillin-binding protein 4)